MTFALDTNIISYALKGNTTIIDRINSTELKGDKVTIPLIVYYEIKRGLSASGATVKLVAFIRLCGRIGVCGLTVTDMDTAAIIYAERKKQGRLIEDTDLLIAAQAVTKKYTLVTNNTRHFEHIDGLMLENWVE